MAAALGGSLLRRPAEALAPPTERPAAANRATVVEVRGDDLLAGWLIRQNILEEMFAWALSRATRQPSAARAWAALIRPGETVGIKFNRVGAAVVGTTTLMAQTIVRSLTAAGVAAERIVLIEAPAGLAAELQTAEPAGGWMEESFDLGRGPEQFAAAVGQVDALISVGFLKTHNLAGLSASMKNLSHGLVRHPARYHENQCSPHVAAILARPELRTRLRLAVIDALRVVFDGGPEATEANLHPAATLLMSTDAVAADAFGLELLSHIRSDRGLPVIGGAGQQVAYLEAAGQLGLGVPYVESVTHELNRM